MRRSLNRFDITCIGLNAIVGSGIFLLPDDLYREMGGLSPLAFLLCAVGLLPIALCYSEAASRFDRSGGPYVYATEAFGPRIGFAVGWMCLANAVFSFAAVASAAAAYLAHFVPAAAAPLLQKGVACGVIALFSALNYAGARLGATAVDVFTVGKFAVLLILVAALLPALSFDLSGPALPRGISGIGAATFMAVFAAQGFEVAPVPAGEMRAPERDVPVAVVGSLALASLLYLVVQVVLVGSSADLTRVSDTPLADAALVVTPALGLVVAAGGLISTLGFVSGSALGTPRYVYAASVDGHLPRGLAGVHPRYESPHRAIVATALLAALLVIPFDYRSLIGMSNVAVAVQYLATCLAVLHFQRASAARRTRAIVPLLGSAMSVWIVTEASSDELAWATASLAIGVLAVALTGFLRRRFSTGDHGL